MLTALELAGVLGRLASVPLIVVYPFMKRITYWPQAFLGITFNWGALVGYAAITGALDARALLLYAAGFFWTLGYDTLYAHQDKEDDALIGVKSTALLLGRGHAALAGRRSRSHAWRCCWPPACSPARAGCSMLAMVPVAWLLLRQARDLRLDEPAECLSRFRANRDVGLAVFAALVLGWPGLTGAAWPG